MRPALLVLLLLVTACSAGQPDGARGPVTTTDPLAGTTDPFEAMTAAEIRRQADEGIARNPLGLLLDGCPIADDAAIIAIGAALGLPDDQAGTVLNAVLQDPDASPGVQCAIGYGNATDGAVVLSLRAGGGDVEAVSAQLTAADYSEVDRPDVAGLPDGSVLLLDADAFAAGRVVYVGSALELSLTANQDLAGTGALLAALPVAVDEVVRTLG